MTNFEYLKRTLTDFQMLEIMAEGIGVQIDTNKVVCCNRHLCKNCKFNNEIRTCREQATEWLIREREEEK